MAGKSRFLKVFLKSLKSGKVQILRLLLISQFIAVDRPHHATVLLGNMSNFLE